MVAIALVPSNQDQNPGATHNYHEAYGMNDLAGILHDELAIRGIKNEIFSGDEFGYESSDKHDLEGLIKQTKAAAAWLDSQEDETKLAIHLHSDSGTSAHTLGIYDGRYEYEHNQNSQRLATELARLCQSVHPIEFDCWTNQLDYGSSSYIFAVYGSPNATSVLIEAFCHQHAPSCNWFVEEEGNYALADIMANKLGEMFSNMTYFPETKHSIGGAFRDYFLGAGVNGVPYFGYPMSEEMQENGRTIQYFERSVFEYWPDVPPAYVQLRRLGADAMEAMIATAHKEKETPKQPAKK
jgi:hypothetical protein